MASCNTTKQALMDQIRALEFTTVDLNLYLDTHPDDERAAMDYSCYSQELMSLKRQYEENFGPLQNFGNSIIGSTFTWVDDPWPWENKEV